MKPLRKVFSSVFFCVLSFCVFSKMEIHAGAYQTIQAEIPIECLPIRTHENEVYEIIIEPENDSSPTPKSDILEISPDGIGKFKIDIDEPATFRYKIYEKAGQNENIQYDSTIYHLTVYVEVTPDDSLTYAVVVTMNDSNQKPEKLEFENIVRHEDMTETTTTPIIDNNIMETTTFTFIDGDMIETTFPPFIDGGIMETSVSTEPPFLDENQEVSTTVVILEELSTIETSTTSVTTTTNAVPVNHRQKPPTVMNHLQDILNPLTGDNTPIGMLWGISAVGAFGILLSHKKQGKKGGADHEPKNQK